MFYAGLAFVLTLLVLAVIMYLIGDHNERMQAKLDKLEQRKEGATMLAHTLQYLTPLGPGKDLEWTNARCIVENALNEVLYGE
jgi:hypothetical protein